MPQVTATQKNQSRALLETSCLNIGSQMFVLASEVNDATLQNFLKTTVSKLQRFRSTDFSIYAKALLKYVTDYSEQVSKVGITEAEVTQLTQESEEYSQLLEDPKEKINKRKILLNSRKQKINETIELINTRFDLLIKGYPTDSAFALDYNAASKVVDPATIHRNVDNNTEEEV